MKRSPLILQPDLLKVTHNLQRQKDHSQQCDCVSYFVLCSSMCAIWFPTGNPAGALSHASKSHPVWQISHHWLETNLLIAGR